MDDKHEAQELTPAQKMEREMREELEQQFRTATRRGAELLDASTKAKMAADSLKETGAAMTDTVQSVIQEVAEFAQSDAFRAIKGTLLTVASFAQQRTEYTEAAERILEAVGATTKLYPFEGTIDEVTPFLAVELERLHKMQPEFFGLTLQELTEKAVELFPAPADPEQLQLDLQLFGNEPEIDPNQAQLFIEALNNAESSLIAFSELSGAVQNVEQAAEAAAEKPGESDPLIEQAAATLPKLKIQSLIPLRHTMPNNTLMNELAGIMGNKPINAGAFDMTVFPASDKKKETTVYVVASYAPEKDLQSNLTEYERSVSDGFVSIYRQAEREKKVPMFTAETLYRAMPGGGERPSPQQKGAITRAIGKFRHLEVELDATEELRKRKVIGASDTYRVKDFYLQAQEHTYTARGGQPVKGWVMTSKPLILDYAEKTKQILEVSEKHLAIEKVKKDPASGKLYASGEIVTMTAARQAMTSYLLRRILVIKNDDKEAREALRKYQAKRRQDSTLEEKTVSDFRSQSSTILFKTVFEMTDTVTTDRTQQKANRDFCFAVLDFWKISGLIKGYTRQAKGRSITGVIIEL